MVSALDSRSSGPGSGPGRGHCVVFLGKTIYSHGETDIIQTIALLYKIIHITKHKVHTQTQGTHTQTNTEQDNVYALILANYKILH